MEYPSTVSIPSPDTVFYGKRVSDLIYPGAFIRSDGIVKAHLKYLEKYELFENSGLNSGHYLPLLINVPGEKIECFKNGESKGSATNDGYVVIRVEADQFWEIKIDGRTIVKLDCSQIQYDEKKGGANMHTGFYSSGVCGVPQIAFVGKLDKDSKTDEVILAPLPDGFALMGFFILPSDDLDNAETVKVCVGCGAECNEYCKDQTLTEKKPAFVDLVLVPNPGRVIKAKVDTAITTGDVSIFAKVVKLSV